MLYFARGSENENLSAIQLREGVVEALDKIGSKRSVLAIPPDITRLNSMAGQITSDLYAYYGKSLKDIMPALGTHVPMTSAEIDKMYPGIPHSLFRVHQWRSEVVTLGEVPADFVKSVSDNKVDYSWPAQANRLLPNGGHDLILSIGQVVPHEVTGMANYNKNILIGVGGTEGINKSHFLGAAYGMERIMGRTDNPVRRVLNYASEKFLADLPIIYILTVVGSGNDGSVELKGLFIGDDYECFELAAELSLKVNFRMLDKPLEKVVVYLDPREFKSTWLGNKSIYRTRMAIADGGELIIIAPGIRSFGEDPEIDRLIRKYGYRSADEILELVHKNKELRDNLSAAAHLMHGFADDRFKITCCPGGLTSNEITSVNYGFAGLDEMTGRYDCSNLKEGFQITPDGEEIYFIPNPAMGLWACRERFDLC